MARAQLTSGLWHERLATASVVSTAAGPVLRIRRGAGRAHVELLLLGGEHTIEVSFHPAAALRLIEEQARRHRRDPNGWTGALARALAADAREWDLGPLGPPVAGDLLRLLGAITHPVLGAAYAAGAGPVGEVPRWASPALAETNAAAAAASLFGSAVATRPAIRVLAHLLARPATAWWHLAVVVAAAPVVGPDVVARALEAAAGEPVIAAGLPTGRDVRVVRRGLALLGATPAQHLLLDALRGGADEGGRRLAAVLGHLLRIEPDLPWPPPSRLQQLELACLRVASLAPHPAIRAPATRTPAPARAAGGRARPSEPAWAVPRRPPAVAGAVPTAHTALPASPLARSLAGPIPEGDVELVLPRTAGELATWGRLLDNCLGDFGPAVAAGRTVVVGVRDQGILVAALEARDGQIVQFFGPHNTRPPARLAALVVRHVEAHF